MGSKTPDEYQQAPNASDSIELKPADQNTKTSQRASTLADLDRGIIGDDGDGDDDGGSGVNVLLSNENKTKRKKPKKKKKVAELGQSTPPRVLVLSLFPFGFSKGELMPYENTYRVTDEESRFNSRLWDEGFLDDYREAAEIHRQVRQYAQKELIKPGAGLLSIADGIEDGVRALSGHQGLATGDSLKASMGFPTGLCLNNIAAHWTPNPGGKDIILQNSDVLKVDFGVQINGRIVDSAFTITFDHTYDNLLAAVKEATNTGILHADVDARMSDIGAEIQEVMESFEIEIGGKFLPVKSIRNITGHDILRYHIHGGKQVPFVRNKNRDKMEEGEVFAIETFGSTGTGYLRDDSGIYGYGRRDVKSVDVQLSSAKSLLKTIDANFGTLVFCRRYLERLGVKNYHLGMKSLIDKGIVESYAPLVDVQGSYTAQFEHTILLHSGGKEVISRGDDY